MNNYSGNTLTEAMKWVVILITGVVFFVISAPFMYQATGWVADKISPGLIAKAGCPNYLGVALHTIVFMIVIRLLMFIKY